MWCTTCGGEFVDEIVTCPDCGTALVAQQPEPVESDDELVQVFQTADASLLPVVKSVLEGAGIPHIVQGEEAQGLYPFGSLGGGSDDRLLGAVVLVPASCREAAEAVLEEIEGLEGLEGIDDSAAPD